MSGPSHQSPSNPILVYDGDCGFCTYWVNAWRGVTGDRVGYATSAEVAALHPDAARPLPPLSHEALDRAVHLVEAAGSVTTGARAVFGALARARGGGALLALYRHLPGFAAVSEAVYRLVAAHRTFFSRATRLFWGPVDRPPGAARVTWLYLRGLGVVFLLAFLSLWLQIEGLVGDRGILPAQDFLDGVGTRAGLERFWWLPTLFWLDASDAALHVVCGAGVVLSLAVVMDRAVGPAVAALWVLYLSLSTVCRDFLGFQWDVLLLETAVISSLLVPWRWGRSGAVRPSTVALLLHRWLLFRLLLQSGLVKLLSGDLTWWRLTALHHHFETQPIPTPLAWFAHQLPGGVLQLATLAMFVVELVLPFFVLGPPRLRMVAAAGVGGLMAMIAATGNYGFFNLLTVLLALLLLDDRWLGRAGPPGGPGPAEGDGRPPFPRAALPRRLALAGVTLVAVGAGSVQTLSLLDRPPEPAAAALRRISPLRSVNRYGLFAIMTTTRPEITVEGSLDGREWRPYEFRWKVQDPHRPPPWVAPHMPRLDWLMWFAALGSHRDQTWYVPFLGRLLEGSPEVLALLADDPFPEGAPRFVRGQIQGYRFTDGEERRGTGRWWSVEPSRPYGPVLRTREAPLPDPPPGHRVRAAASDSEPLVGQRRGAATLGRIDVSSGRSPRRRPLCQPE